MLFLQSERGGSVWEEGGVVSFNKYITITFSRL